MSVTNLPRRTETRAAPRRSSAPEQRGPARPLLREFAQILGLYVLSAAALCWLFPPYGLGLLAFVGLVPWAVATCRATRAWLVHWLSFAVGGGFFLVALRWLMPVTWPGYVALGLYLAIYWTLAAWGIRMARRHGISCIWSLPVVWVACEFLRALVMTGFPWLFLAHGVYDHLPLIQISDLTGAYGVSFLAAMVNGLLVELTLRRWPAPTHRPSRAQLWSGAAATAGLLIATLAYGAYRLHEVDFAADPNLRGPRVAVVQHDFPLVSTPPYGESPYVILAAYLKLGAEAAQQRPDLVVFPETVWAAVQNRAFVELDRSAVDAAHAREWAYGSLCHEAVSAFARGEYSAVNRVLERLESLTGGAPLPRLPDVTGPAVPVLVGSVSVEFFPEATYPKVKRYNSALMYDAEGRQEWERYDKCHLVPFGEFVPFRQSKFLGIDLHYWLYRPLNKLSPFSNRGSIEYSLTPGDAYTVFVLPTAARRYTFGTPICYEDTTPYVVRRFVWSGRQRRVDFLANISNDGWFQHSHELPQHLAICAFRAVENRVSIARAVNTGMSGFIDSDGRIYSRVTDAAGRSYGAGVVGFDIAHVRLDPRSSVYGRFGDWLAWLCLLGSAVLWLGAVFERWILTARRKILAFFRKGLT